MKRKINILALAFMGDCLTLARNGDALSPWLFRGLGDLQHIAAEPHSG